MVKSKLTRRERRFLMVGEWTLIGAGAVILLVFLASTLDGLNVRNGGEAAVISAIIADLTNTDRGVNKVASLTVNPTLTAIAQAKANDMASKGYFAHTSPDGHDPWYWFQQGSYSFSFAGENLAIDFSDSADVERAWMNSPTHRANLLNPHFTEIGVATAIGTYQGHATTFVVQEFGTPAMTALSNTPSSVQAAVPSSPTEIAIATTGTKPASSSPANAVIASTSSSKPAHEVLGAATGAVANPPASATGLQSIWNVFAASPKTTLRYAYYLFGLLILIALVIETGLEIRRHHLRHVYVAVALLVLMAGLFFIADQYVFTSPTIIDTGAASNSA